MSDMIEELRTVDELKRNATLTTKGGLVGEKEAHCGMSPILLRGDMPCLFDGFLDSS